MVVCTIKVKNIGPLSYVSSTDVQQNAKIILKVSLKKVENSIVEENNVQKCFKRERRRLIKWSGLPRRDHSH